LVGEEFKAPKMQYELATVKEKLTLDFDGYGKRVADDVIKQLNPIFKIAQAKVREIDELKKRNAELEEIQRNHDSVLLEKNDQIEKLQNKVTAYVSSIFYFCKKINLDIGRSLSVVKDQSNLIVMSEDKPLNYKIDTWFNKVKQFLPIKIEKEKKKEKTVEQGHSL
jgi:hypothetical protein